eukprot:42017-Eustigmatos_ZCMA.PRE.1
MLLDASEYPYCAWQASTDTSVYTPLLLDPNACYRPLLLSFAGHMRRIFKVSGHFPESIYFSYQANTLWGDSLDSLVDYMIVPSEGKNPYADISATPETAGKYDIHVTYD